MFLKYSLEPTSGLCPGVVRLRAAATSAPASDTSTPPAHPSPCPRSFLQTHPAQKTTALSVRRCSRCQCRARPAIFCRKCFLTAMRESGIHCTLCRGSVTRRGRACPKWAIDLENIMRRVAGSCRCYSKKIKFYRMRHNYKSCKKYQDEYGVSSVVPDVKISQDSVRSSSSGHPIFKGHLGVPYACQESNFTRQRLLDHCNSNHLFQIVPTTCPICVSLSWGDPSQITGNFISHLNQRYQFDYGAFVSLQLDEETQYQTAVEESFQVNICCV